MYIKSNNQVARGHLNKKIRAYIHTHIYIYFPFVCACIYMEYICGICVYGVCVYIYSTYIYGKGKEKRCIFHIYIYVRVFQLTRRACDSPSACG